MTLTFQINYRTEYGQTLCLIEVEKPILGLTEANCLALSCQGQDFWTGSIDVAPKGTLHYKYAIRLQDGSFVYEDGEPRILVIHPTQELIIRDFWQVEDLEKPFYTKAFLHSLFNRIRPQKPYKPLKTHNLYFSIDAPQVLPTQGVGIMGNIPELGEWSSEHFVPMNDGTFPIWSISIKSAADVVVEYKYCIYDLQTRKIVDMEWGENRIIWGLQKGIRIQQNDRCFHRTQQRFKGAGVAIPVFSLRTEDGLGIGEYLDLKKMADWAALTGQKMIQTLPINDTTLTHTNRDSYPYNAVSVFALHPIYLNIAKMGKLSAALKKQYDKERKEFNQKTIADYQCVYDAKMVYFKALFENEGEEWMKKDSYKEFYKKNHAWLDPYVTFMSQRDGMPKEFYCYLQHHANLQLSEAVQYAHSKGVAIKGDIPIGISPDSVDAHFYPELFHLNASAGAPPDDFDARGQNWGFPTYNWDMMAKDNYSWWRQRFRKMQDYFDAYRIDHILGFFRIWQMRKSDVWGLCGHFNPALPYTLQDLWNMGVCLDEDRMVKPYIRNHFLGDVFGYDTELAKATFLNTNDGYIYWFKEEYDTQVKVQTYFESEAAKQLYTPEQITNLCNGLLYLHCEVLFVRDQTNEQLLHPRISIYQSHSFNDLYNDQREVLMGIYNDYFYRRHTQFWRESALRKLPTLISATGMLCCGEDLGMVPECVPDVMHQLQILSLEIQRMPKDPTMAFAHPSNAPYLSVCTTGTHDTNPLRAWWEEDKQVTQQFYNEQMGWWGEAPDNMTPEIAEFVVNQHLYSPAMWVILPWQDWMAIDGELRLADAQGERINLPSNPRHFWNYRMHIKLEDLLKADNLNSKLKNLIQRASR